MPHVACKQCTCVNNIDNVLNNQVFTLMFRKNDFFHFSHSIILRTGKSCSCTCVNNISILYGTFIIHFNTLIIKFVHK